MAIDTTNQSNADSQFIWMEGELVPYAEARVPVLSHSLHYGTGAFEGMRAYSTLDRPALFRGKEHFDRFLDSIKTLGCQTRHSSAALLAATHDVIRANGFKECYVRPLAYLGDGFRGLKLPENPSMLIAIASWNWGKYMGVEGQKNGIRVNVSSFRRGHPSTAMAAAKLTGNYLTSVLARREATRAGMDEAILLDSEGYVGEGSGENLFMVQGGELFTPPSGAILPGITRDSVLQLGRYLGYRCTEKRLTRNDLYLADELFFTGTAAELTPIREVDHHPIGEGRPGPITRALSENFFKCVHGDLAEFRHWLH